jgi:hypothetical protein
MVGCGCAAATDNPPLAFTPSSMAAVRTPSGCGVADPPYGANDVFTLTVVGSTSGPAPYNTLTLSMHDTSASTTAVPLTVPMASGSAPATLQTAASADSDITFSFSRGSNAAEIDSNFLSSVLVTVVSVPGADGQDLSASLALTFTDGSELQATYTAAVTTTNATCVTSGIRKR